MPYDFEREFDRQFNRTAKAVFVMWAVSAVLGLTVVGVVLWAIVRVVQHFT